MNPKTKADMISKCQHCKGKGWIETKEKNKCYTCGTSTRIVFCKEHKEMRDFIIKCLEARSKE